MRERLAFATKALVLTSFVCVLTLGALRLRRRSREAPRHLVNLSNWAVISRPQWQSIEEVQRLRAETGLVQGTFSLLDDGALARIEQTFVGVPQVRAVAAVRRRMPDRLQIALELRRPAAAVRLDGELPRYVTVDDEGVVLDAPGPDRARESGRVICGVGDSAPAPGGAFGPEVLEAIRLGLRLDAVDLEDPLARMEDLDEIDVSNFRGRVDAAAAEIVLRQRPAASAVPHGTGDGVVVEWGRFADLAGDGVEPRFAAKLAHLQRAYALHPRLDGVRRVRVAFKDLVVVPLPKTAEPDPLPAPVDR